MFNKCKGVVVLLFMSLSLLGCSRPAGKIYILPSGKQIRITSIVPMHFSRGGDALVMNCETDISIDDMADLRKEVDEIWGKFENDVEGAGMSNGVIRMVHPEGSGLVTQSRGFGFVFQKEVNGQWQCLQDAKK
jgi:hypothetical protein